MGNLRKMQLLVIFTLYIIFIFSFEPLNARNLDTTGTLWAPYIDWSFSNASYSDNPFDLIATGTFTHSGSGETRITEMFFAGNNTWKLRFCATRTGTWTVSTSSSDQELNAHTGTITVNPNPNIKGFLTHSGNKWARQISEKGDLEGFLFNVYHGNGMVVGPLAWHNSASLFADLDADVDSIRKYGCSVLYTGVVANGWLKIGVQEYNAHSSVDPDLKTFEACEKAIPYLHQNNVHVHFWAWGDNDRKQTPVGLSGGINGTIDRRVQRYIGARLGPIPGWSMGYGFDLQEWVSESQVGSWATYMHQHTGWNHMLMARGRFHSDLDANSYSYLDHPYSDALNNLQDDQSRPHLFSERDVYMRSGNTMDVTRRHLWQYTMAGGHGGWWGWWPNYSATSYPNPEQLRTHYRFWITEARFPLDMTPANSLTDGYCLKTPDNSNFVFYKENTSSIQWDISSMDGSRNLIAVDTKKAYAEIDLGLKGPGSYTWSAPYASDWAIAIGEGKVNNIKSDSQHDCFGKMMVYPNPFKHYTTIRFNILESQKVSLKLFDINGVQIDDLAYGKMDKGFYSVKWKNRTRHSGVMIARLKAGSNFLTRKVLVLR